MVTYAFNATQFSPQFGGSSQLPPGKGYVGVISESSQENTKDGQGGFLLLILKVIDGPLTGESQPVRLNLHNKEAKAVDIANRQLSAFCHVLNKPAFQDTAELHNIPFKFDVGVQKNNDKYTEVTALYDINGNEPGKQSAAPQTYAPPAPAYAPPAPVAATGGGWPGAPAPTAAPSPPPPAAAPGGWGQPPGGQAPAAGGWAQGAGGQTKPAWG